MATHVPLSLLSDLTKLSVPVSRVRNAKRAPPQSGSRFAAAAEPRQGRNVQLPEAVTGVPPVREPAKASPVLPQKPIAITPPSPPRAPSRLKTPIRRRVSSPNLKNAYDHPVTRPRVVHLVQKTDPAAKDLAFIYDKDDVDTFTPISKMRLLNSSTEGEVTRDREEIRKGISENSSEDKAVVQKPPAEAGTEVDTEVGHLPGETTGRTVSEALPCETDGKVAPAGARARHEGPAEFDVPERYRDIKSEDLSVAVVKDIAQTKREALGIHPGDFKLVIPSGRYETAGGLWQPSLMPTTRKEVIELRDHMRAMLKSAGLDSDFEYPTDMHALISVVEEENSINDSIFQEIIRQVTINMVERGEILAEIRKRYANMFARIPKHVKNLHTELVAQRKLSRRLAKELIQSKETVSQLMRELDYLKKHDERVTTEINDAHKKLLSVFTASDNTDEVLEEYHKLYRLQRSRLEETVKNAEREKRIWIDAATSLALRIGAEHGISDLAQLQKIEHARLRATNHAVILISNANDSDLAEVDRKIEVWRANLMKISQSVIDEDQQNFDTLAGLMRDIRSVFGDLAPPADTETVEPTDHQLLKAFHAHDAKNTVEYLGRWAQQINSVAVRFTSDRDVIFQEEIVKVRKQAEAWMEAAGKLLARNEKTTNGADYTVQLDGLSNLHKMIGTWIAKLERRVAGDDGLARLVISLQNQLEDRYTTYSAKDTGRPLPVMERSLLKESLESWSEIISSSLGLLSKTAEKDQSAVRQEIDNWMARILEQMNTDTEIRTEENNKLHISIINWMVQLLVRSGQEAPNEIWDSEFNQLSQEIVAFNVNIMKDCGNIEMVSDDGKDLRKVVLNYCDNWISVARRLLEKEKQRASKSFEFQKTAEDEEIKAASTAADDLVKALGLDLSFLAGAPSTSAAPPAATPPPP